MIKVLLALITIFMTLMVGLLMMKLCGKKLEKECDLDDHYLETDNDTKELIMILKNKRESEGDVV